MYLSTKYFNPTSPKPKFVALFSAERQAKRQRRAKLRELSAVGFRIALLYSKGHQQAARLLFNQTIEKHGLMYGEATVLKSEIKKTIMTAGSFARPRSH